MDLSKPLLISADANEQIGLGHLMRCLSIADAARDKGLEVLFAVSNEFASSLVKQRGFRSVRLSRNESCYSDEDARSLLRICEEESVRALLVDSYAVNERFFALLDDCAVHYIDDRYTYSSGHVRSPRFWPIEGVIDYGFGSRLDQYEGIYAEDDVDLLIGPKYAPVRKAFHESAFVVRDAVERILITSGSTNPDHILERMCQATLHIFPTCKVDVVVGPRARFDMTHDAAELNIYEGMDDLSALMASCDLAVSSGGTTLYELAAIGVPTVAIPIVENQMENIRGFDTRGLGCVLYDISPSFEAISCEIAKMASSRSLRAACSGKMRAVMGLDGASLIVESICAPGRRCAPM